MADLTRFQPRSGNIFENLGSLRDQLRDERTRERAEEMVGKPGGAKRDVLGNLKERPWLDKLDGLDQDALEAEVNNVEREIKIKDIIRPDKSIMYDSDGDGNLEKYTIGDLGIDAPSWDTFKTKGDARAWVNQKVIDQVVKNRANKAGLVIDVPEGGFKPGQQEAAVRAAELKREEADEDLKVKNEQERKWGKRGDGGAAAGTQTQGVSGAVSPGTLLAQGPGPGATMEAQMEWAKHKSGLLTEESGRNLNTSQINIARRGADRADNKFEYEKYRDDRQWNNDITIEQMKQAAAKATVEAKNAHAIKLHDLQHIADMEFFDRKESAYNQERNMGYIQGGLGALMSLFMLQ